MCCVLGISKEVEDALAVLRRKCAVSDRVMDQFILVMSELLGRSAIALGAHPDHVRRGLGVPTLGVTAKKLKQGERLSFDLLVSVRCSYSAALWGGALS